MNAFRAICVTCLCLGFLAAETLVTGDVVLGVFVTAYVFIALMTGDLVVSCTRHLLHRLGWHRFCRPTWRRIGATGSTANSAGSTTAVLLADYSEHR